MSKKHSQETLATLIRNAGYKVTAPRLLILSLLEQSKYPVCIKDLASRLLKANVDQVTAYRTLSAFEKSGIVTQVDFKRGSSYYELRDEQGDHHHIVCTTCHKVEDFKGCEYEKLAAKALRQVKAFATITAHSFEFFGLCKGCAVSIKN
ncbi:MAG: Fur family transcriptional regulator [Patescibacteria group bacterium]